MATIGKRRRGSDSLEVSAKKLRLGEKAIDSPTDGPLPADDDNDSDNYQPDGGESSEDEHGTETPVTPFSPTRKKFPSQLKTIRCSYQGCDKTFNRPSRLTAHLRSHTNDRPFQCTYEGCDKAYLEEKHLKQHIKGSHTKEREFHCQFCIKSFLTATRLRRHEDTHRGHDRFRCTGYPPCDMTFRKHNTLQRHIRSEHLDLTPFPCTHIDPITAEPCSAGFDGLNGLRKHQERIHGAAKFFCLDCVVPGGFNADGTPLHLGFTSEKLLESHFRKEHPVCAFCDLKCSNNSTLQKHIESQHSGTTLQERKVVPCTYIGCEKRFTTQYNLKTHIKTAHEGSRFICGTFDLSSRRDISKFDPKADGCGKDFVSKQTLVDHIRTAHLGLRSIVNGHRKKKDQSDVDMVSDIDTDDGEEYVPPVKKRTRKKVGSEPSAIEVLTGLAYANDPARKHPCSVAGCGYRFIRQYDLENHMRIAHYNLSPEDDPDFAPFEHGFGYPQQGAPSPVDSAGPESGGAGGGTPFFEQGDVHWELQQRAAEGGQFWVGAELENSQNQDTWAQDSEEMRRLIG